MAYIDANIDGDMIVCQPDEQYEFIATEDCYVFFDRNDIYYSRSKTVWFAPLRDSLIEVKEGKSLYLDARKLNTTHRLTIIDKTYQKPETVPFSSEFIKIPFDDNVPSFTIKTNQNSQKELGYGTIDFSYVSSDIIGYKPDVTYGTGINNILFGANLEIDNTSYSSFIVGVNSKLYGGSNESLIASIDSKLWLGKSLASAYNSGLAMSTSLASTDSTFTGNIENSLLCTKNTFVNFDQGNTTLLTSFTITDDKNFIRTAIPVLSKDKKYILMTKGSKSNIEFNILDIDDDNGYEIDIDLTDFLDDNKSNYMVIIDKDKLDKYDQASFIAPITNSDIMGSDNFIDIKNGDNLSIKGVENLILSTTCDFGSLKGSKNTIIIDSGDSANFRIEGMSNDLRSNRTMINGDFNFVGSKFSEDGTLTNIIGTNNVAIGMDIGSITGSNNEVIDLYKSVGYAYGYDSDTKKLKMTHSNQDVNFGFIHQPDLYISPRQSKPYINVSQKTNEEIDYSSNFENSDKYEAFMDVNNTQGGYIYGNEAQNLDYEYNVLIDGIFNRTYNGQLTSNKGWVNITINTNEASVDGMNNYLASSKYITVNGSGNLANGLYFSNILGSFNRVSSIYDTDVDGNESKLFSKILSSEDYKDDRKKIEVTKEFYDSLDTDQVFSGLNHITVLDTLGVRPYGLLITVSNKYEEDDRYYLETTTDVDLTSSRYRLVSSLMHEYNDNNFNDALHRSGVSLVGSDNKIMSNYANIFGQKLYLYNKDQKTVPTVVGIYNVKDDDITTNNAFILGIGLGESRRRDGFRIDWEGVAELPYSDKDKIKDKNDKALVTKEYLKESEVSSSVYEFTSEDGQTEFIIEDRIVPKGSMIIFTERLKDRASEYNVETVNDTDTKITFDSGKSDGDVVEVTVLEFKKY